MFLNLEHFGFWMFGLGNAQPGLAMNKDIRKEKRPKEKILLSVSNLNNLPLFFLLCLPRGQKVHIHPITQLDLLNLKFLKKTRDPMLYNTHFVKKCSLK
jgi:hypothetical protein